MGKNYSAANKAYAAAKARQAAAPKTRTGGGSPNPGKFSMTAAEKKGVADWNAGWKASDAAKAKRLAAGKKKK